MDSRLFQERTKVGYGRVGAESGHGAAAVAAATATREDASIESSGGSSQAENSVLL